MVATIRQSNPPNLRLVAPLSTVRYERKAHVSPHAVPGSASVNIKSNIPKGTNWTDNPAPGTVVLVQEPEGPISVALLGDIMVTRLRLRGVRGVVVDGRVRDVESCAACCEDGNFQVWSKGFSAAAPSLEVVPWAIDVPLQYGTLFVRPGDILCADDGDRAVVVIPQELLHQMLDLLPTLKEASDNVLEDVRNGMTLPNAVKRHPKFYSNYS
jgi:regulator of RNase E activity RraA